MPPEDNATPANSAPAAPPPAPPAAPPAVLQTQEPNWLPDRLARAADAQDKKRLQELGVASFDELGKLVKVAKDAAESTKSLTDKYADAAKTVTVQAQQLDEVNAVIKARAESEFASLTAEQQAAVTALAGDNHAARLKAITALSPTWVKPAVVTSETKTVPAPANTSPNVQKPTTTPPAPPAADDAAKLSTYENLQKTNPVAAAGYMLQNFQALQRARGVS